MKFSKILPFAIAATAVGAGAAVRYRFKSDADFRRNTEELAGRAVNGIVKGISDFLPSCRISRNTKAKISIPDTANSEIRERGEQDGVSAMPAAVSSPRITSHTTII